MIRLTLSVPPSVNHYWKNRRGGGRYVGEAGQAYHKAVGEVCRTHGLSPFTGRVVMTVTVYRKENRGDLDNYCKALLDALAGHAYVNDKQVYELHLYKALDRKNPRVELTIDELPELPVPTTSKRRTLS